MSTSIILDLIREGGDLVETLSKALQAIVTDEQNRSFGDFYEQAGPDTTVRMQIERFTERSAENETYDLQDNALMARLK